MKLARVALALLGCASSPVLWAADSAGASCDSLTGVWEYVAPSPPGRAVIAKLGNKYAFTAIQTPRAAGSTSAPSTDSAAFSASAGAYEYSCQGSGGKFRWQMRTLYSLKPEEVGSTSTLEMEVKGDTATWWFLDSAGKRGATGSARLVK